MEIGISITALLIAIISLVFAIRLGNQQRDVKRSETRSRILNRIIECQLISNEISQNLEKIGSYESSAFANIEGFEGKDGDKLLTIHKDSLKSVEEMYRKLSDYDDAITMQKLQDASTLVDAMLEHMHNLLEKTREWKAKLQMASMLAKPDDSPSH